MRPNEIEAARRLITTALQEDLGQGFDITTALLIPPQEQGEVEIVARETGILCGGKLLPLIAEMLAPEVHVREFVIDGEPLQRGTVVARLSGKVTSLLTLERTALNFLTFLSGVSTLTWKFVVAAGETTARVYDTRKTVPGLRELQKYAVRCGGGMNHRMGLFDAVLVKDNHLAAWRQQGDRTLAGAVRHVRTLAPAGMFVEVEVDTLSQLQEILPEQPDAILLDNMPPDDLLRAVRLRNELAQTVQLEASGGISLQTIRSIAETGVDRISVGALTHSAPALDLGFDWRL
jgi:nicotinate-nucleotide pyrophosphorylase (carboxylating)